jgi:hypothetical protein
MQQTAAFELKFHEADDHQASAQQREAERKQYAALLYDHTAIDTWDQKASAHKRNKEYGEKYLIVSTLGSWCLQGLLVCTIFYVAL